MQDLDELDRLRDLTPARVLRSLAVLRARLTAPGSTAGLIAERCRLGLATRESYQGDGGSTQRSDLAWLLGLTKDLTDMEARCCSLRYGGTGEPVGYEAVRRIDALTEGDGEEIVSLHPRDLDGRPVGAGWVRVEGQRERMASFAEVGGALNLTARQAQRHLEEARDKIAAAIKWRLFQAEQQARYH